MQVDPDQISSHAKLERKRSIGTLQRDRAKYKELGKQLQGKDAEQVVYDPKQERTRAQGELASRALTEFMEVTQYHPAC